MSIGSARILILLLVAVLCLTPTVLASSKSGSGHKFKPHAPSNSSFSVFASPNAVAINPGDSLSVDIIVTSFGSFSAPVALSSHNTYPADGQTSALLQESFSVSFRPSVVTPPVGRATKASATISVGVNTLAGFYFVNINGVSKRGAQSTVVEVNVLPKPDFAMTFNPPQVTLAAGTTTTVQVTVKSLNVFSGSVLLFGYWVGSDPGPAVMTSMQPVRVQVSSVQDGVATFTISTAPNAQAVDLAFRVDGTWAGTFGGTWSTINHTADLPIHVTVSY